MNEHIEIEYKILIHNNTFESILNDYKKDILHDYTQTNFYFTHPLLEKNKYMLRIREKNNTYELTLKRPTKKHRLETNVTLTKQEAELFFSHQNIQNEITNILLDMGISLQNLKQQFSLTTHRYDIKLENGILSLDKNDYLGVTDYEIEFEVNDEHRGYQQFLEIIKPYHLQYSQNCASKIKRVLDVYNKSNKI